MPFHPAFFNPRQRQRGEEIPECWNERLEIEEGDRDRPEEKRHDQIRHEEDDGAPREALFPCFLSLHACVAFEDGFDVMLERMGVHSIHCQLTEW